MPDDIELVSGEAKVDSKKEDNIVPEPVSYPPDYIERMKEKNEELARFLPHSELGPIFSICTPRGEVVRIDSFYVDGQANGKKIRRYYLIAQNINGEVIGDSSTDVSASKFEELKAKNEGSDPSEVRKMTADGFTATGVRGIGIGTQLELAKAVVLQKYASENQKEVVWHASNYNREVLEDLKQKRTQTPDEDLEKQIAEKEAEQASWMKIYGPGGRLGMNAEAERIITDETTFDTTNPNFKIEDPEKDTELYKRQKSEAIQRVLERVKRVAEHK